MIVSFDGCSDEGQIANIEVHAGDVTVPMPAGHIELTCAVWGRSTPKSSAVSINDAVEHFVYVLLDATHSG